MDELEKIEAALGEPCPWCNRKDSSTCMRCEQTGSRRWWLDTYTEVQHYKKTHRTSKATHPGVYSFRGNARVILCTFCREELARMDSTKGIVKAHRTLAREGHMCSTRLQIRKEIRDES